MSDEGRDMLEQAVEESGGYRPQAVPQHRLDEFAFVGALLLDATQSWVRAGLEFGLRPQHIHDIEGADLYRIAVERFERLGDAAGVLAAALVTPPTDSVFAHYSDEMRRGILADFAKRAAPCEKYREYAQIVAENGARRERQAIEDELRHELTVLHGEPLLDGGTAAVARIRGLADKLEQLAEQATPTPTIDTHRAASMVAETEALVARRCDGIERPLRTGIGKLDAALSLPGYGDGGLLPGSHMLVGGTGTGKSQLASQIALHAATECGAVVWLSALELGRHAMVMRLTAQATGDTTAQWSHYWWGKARLPGDVARRWASYPIYIEQAPPHGWSYRQIERWATALRERYPDKPILMVVDFLQLVSSPSERTREELRERIGHAGYAAQSVATRYGVTMLLVSSTARDNYDRLNFVENRPRFDLPETAARLVGTGKESGELEFSVDTLLALGQGGVEPITGHKYIVLAVAKQRASVPSWVPLMFDGTRLRDGEFPPEADEPTRKAADRPKDRLAGKAP